MAEQLRNSLDNPTSTLAAGISDSDVTITVASGHGSRFPATGDFRVKLTDASDDSLYELVKATGRTGDAITVERAAESGNGGGAARAFSSGDLVDLVLSAAALTAELAASQTAAEATAAAALAAHLGDTTDAHDASAISIVDAGGHYTGSTVEAALQEAAESVGSQPPLDYQGTDPDEAVLTLRADDAQTEHIFRVYDDAGDLAVDVDFQGKFDTRVMTIQDPPDTGGPPGSSGSRLSPSEWVINSGSDTSSDPFQITKWVEALGNTRRRLLVKYADTEILEFSPIESEVSITIAAPATPTGDAIEMWDHPFNNLLFVVTYEGEVVAGKGIGAFGVTPPAAQPAEPTTMNEVVAILQGAGLSA